MSTGVGGQGDFGFEKEDYVQKPPLALPEEGVKGAEKTVAAPLSRDTIETAAAEAIAPGLAAVGVSADEIENYYRKEAQVSLSAAQIHLEDLFSSPKGSMRSLMQALENLHKQNQKARQLAGEVAEINQLLSLMRSIEGLNQQLAPQVQSIQQASNEKIASIHAEYKQQTADAKSAYEQSVSQVQEKINTGNLSASEGQKQLEQAALTYSNALQAASTSQKNALAQNVKTTAEKLDKMYEAMKFALQLLGGGITNLRGVANLKSEQRNKKAQSQFGQALDQLEALFRQVETMHRQTHQYTKKLTEITTTKMMSLPAERIQAYLVRSHRA